MSSPMSQQSNMQSPMSHLQSNLQTPTANFTSSHQSASVNYHPGRSVSGTSMIGQETVQSSRVVSSAILREENLVQQPEDTVKYIEVPVVEEVIRHVTKKEVVEVEKRVPKIRYEYVERVVEVPQVEIVQRNVEVPQIKEVVKRVPVKQYVDVVKENVTYVPKIETKIIEQTVEVPGETIEVAKPYTVEQKVVVPHYIDEEVATVVAQKLQPIIVESDTDFIDVELKEYDPYLVPIDVYIPRPVARHLIAGEKTEEHRVVDVPAAQYNALVRQVNTHVQDKDTSGLYVTMADGTIPMGVASGNVIVDPVSDDWIVGHTKGQVHVSMVQSNVVQGNIGAANMGLVAGQQGRMISSNGITTTQMGLSSPSMLSGHSGSGGHRGASVRSVHTLGGAAAAGFVAAASSGFAGLKSSNLKTSVNTKTSYGTTYAY